MFNAGIELPLTIHVHRTNVVLVCPTPAGPIVLTCVRKQSSGSREVAPIRQTVW